MHYAKKLMVAGPKRAWNTLGHEPITRSLQLQHIPATAFSQTDLFLVNIYLEFRSYRNLIDQLQSQAWTVSLSREAALFYPYRSVLM